MSPSESGSGSLQGGVYPGREVGVHSKGLQQLEELLALRFVESGNQTIVVLVGDSLCFGQQVVCVVGEMHGVRTTVIRVPLPSYQSPLFEFVDDSDHRVAVNPHRIREPLLGLSVV